MKTTTNFLKALYVLAFVMLLSTNYNCAAFLDAEFDGKEMPMKGGLPDMEKIEQLIIEDFRNNNKDLFPKYNYYSQNFLEVSGGLGLDSTEGESETSFCLGAGYNYRISEDNFNRATYLKGFATQHFQNADERKFNVTRVGLGATFFDRASRNGKLDLTYGIDASYGFGTFENFNFKEDYTELKFEFDIGANYSVSPSVDLGITIPVASWAQQTFEAEGVKFEQEHTWVGVNKDNMVMAYARINLDKK